jgi:hypothetical protein
MSGGSLNRPEPLPVKANSFPLPVRHSRTAIIREQKTFLHSIQHNIPTPGCFRGKGLTLGGSHRVNKCSNDSLYGDLSAILIENAPFWVDLIRTPKSEVALIEDFEEKLEKITEITINENVTSISGVPSWYLVLLKHILNYTGKNNILEIWPNIEVFFHGGISFEPYRQQFNRIIPHHR